MPRDREDGALPTGEQAARAALDVPKDLMKEAGKTMLRDAPRGARIVAKRIPGLPGLVYDAASLVNSPNRTKTAFGLAGGAIGGCGGGILGDAAGGINASIGAAGGSVYGEQIADDFYDDHKAEIDRKASKTAKWMKDRWADVRGAHGRAADDVYRAVDAAMPHSPGQRR